MNQFLINLATSPPALVLYAIILSIVVGVIVKKYPWVKKYTDIAADVFTWIEDNYRSWGIRGNEKLDYFVKEFIARYYNEFGKIPTEDIIENAVRLVEELVAAQNRIIKENISTV